MQNDQSDTPGEGLDPKALEAAREAWDASPGNDTLDMAMQDAIRAYLTALRAHSFIGSDTAKLLTAVDAFRMLFVADTDPPALTTDIDPNDLANAFDELSKAVASARRGSDTAGLPADCAGLVERLRAESVLPVCPFDKRSPDYWTHPNDKPCKVCGSEPDGPDKCTGADLRIMKEAAEAIAALSRAPELFGPHGWLIMPEGLAEDAWYLSDGPEPGAPSEPLYSPKRLDCAAFPRPIGTCLDGRALADIAAERRRQIEAEGWTPEHDDQHSNGSLAQAAACYAVAHIPYEPDGTPLPIWPWEPSWWKPTSHRRDLVKAGALIIAEIERLDRLPARPKAGSDQ